MQAAAWLEGVQGILSVVLCAPYANIAMIPAVGSCTRMRSTVQYSALKNGRLGHRESCTMRRAQHTRDWWTTERREGGEGSEVHVHYAPLCAVLVECGRQARVLCAGGWTHSTKAVVCDIDCTSTLTSSVIRESASGILRSTCFIVYTCTRGRSQWVTDCKSRDSGYRHHRAGSWYLDFRKHCFASSFRTRMLTGSCSIRTAVTH